MLQLFRSSWRGGAQAQALSETCPLPLCTYFFPHQLPPFCFKKTYVVLGYGLVRRSKPTTRIVIFKNFWYSTRA